MAKLARITADAKRYKNAIEAALQRFNEHAAKGRDWGGDFQFENGNYQNICCYCGLTFLGNKHRVLCRQCHNKISKLNWFKRLWIWINLKKK